MTLYKNFITPPRHYKMGRGVCLSLCPSVRLSRASR